MVRITAITQIRNDRFYVDMVYQNAKEWADEHIFVDGFSTDGTWERLQFLAKEDSRIKLIQHKGAKSLEWVPELEVPVISKDMDFGAARQAAYEKATGDWVFWIDADEALEDGARKELENATKNNLNAYVVRYEHFIHHFKQVDSAEPIHKGIMRFHKNLPENLRLDTRKNHALPTFVGKIETPVGYMLHPILWHCGYVNGMPKIFERYWRNVNASSFHDPMYQMFWKEWHYRGTYPTKPSNEVISLNGKPPEVPLAIQRRFRIAEFKMNQKEKEAIIDYTPKEDKKK